MTRHSDREIRRGGSSRSNRGGRLRLGKLKRRKGGGKRLHCQEDLGVRGEGEEEQGGERVRLGVVSVEVVMWVSEDKVGGEDILRVGQRGVQVVLAGG
jgi:hypothetical protein